MTANEDASEDTETYSTDSVASVGLQTFSEQLTWVDADDDQSVVLSGLLIWYAAADATRAARARERASIVKGVKSVRVEQGEIGDCVCINLWNEAVL